MSGWNVLAWTLGVLGGVGVLVAWFQDQSRGRRRCPRCWYSMASVPGLQCPECGRTATHEGLLWKTRRRKGLAALFAVLCASGFATHWAAKSAKAGWPTVAPAWFLAMNYGKLDDWGQAWDDEPLMRFRSDSPRHAPSIGLLNGAYRVLIHPKSDPDDRVRASEFLMLVDFRSRTRRQGGTFDRLDMLSTKPERLPRAIAALLASGTTREVARATDFFQLLLTTNPDLARDITCEVVSVLANQDQLARELIYRAFRDIFEVDFSAEAQTQAAHDTWCEPCNSLQSLPNDQQLSAVLDLLQHPAPGVRTPAVLTAALLDSAHFREANLGEAAMHDRDPFVRTAGLAATLFTAESEDKKLSVLLGVMSGDDLTLRLAAVQWLRGIVGGAKPLPPELRPGVMQTICLAANNAGARRAISAAKTLLSTAGTTVDDVLPIASESLNAWPQENAVVVLGVLGSLRGDSAELADWVAVRLAAETDANRFAALTAAAGVNGKATPTLVNNVIRELESPDVPEAIHRATHLINVLAKLRPAPIEALPVLETYLGSQDRDLQRVAEHAIHSIKDGERSFDAPHPESP